jgi:hypothetical protein
MEAWYGPDHIDPVLVLKLLYALEIEAHPEHEKALRADWELSQIMVEGWAEFAQAEGIDSVYEVIATEEDLTVPLPGFEGAVLLRGKLDQAVRDTRTGLLAYRDWKTADSFLRTEMIEMDPQMKTYALIQWLRAGHPVPVAGRAWESLPDVPLVHGGIVDTLKRVKRTKQAKPPFYQHHPFTYSPERIAAHLLLLQQAVAEIMNAREALDQGYAGTGGAMNVINHIHRTKCRPVEIPRDCDWRCPFSKGLCQLMSADGAWNDALVSSGRYVQGDPYAYYTRGGLDTIKAALEAQEG